MKSTILFASLFFLYGTFCITSEESGRSLSSFKASGKDKALKTWIDSKVLHLAATSYGPTGSTFPTFLTEISDDLLSAHELSQQQCSKPIHENRVNILIVGDSVSRFMAQDWCMAHTGSAASIWGVSILYERARHEATGACQGNNITIGFVHILGSEAVGPYPHGYVNTEKDTHVDTNLRVPYAIQQYTAAFGQPSVVLFRTDLWDLSNFLDDPSRHLENRTSIMERIIHNHFWLIDFIHENLPDAYVGSHTIPSITWGMHLFHFFQNAARYVSSARNTFLLEWDHLLAARFWEEPLRDGHHPKPEACVLFTDLLTTLLQTWSCVRPVRSA